MKDNNLVIKLFGILFITILFISIGYSSLSTTLSINGSATFRPVGMIRVMSITDDVFNKSSSIESSFTKDTISVLLDINELDGTASYNVNITNLGETNKVLSKVINETFSNDNITYTLEGITIGKKIVPKQSIDFKVVFKFKDGVSAVDVSRLNAKLKFIFDDYVEGNIKLAYFQEYNGNSSLFGFDKASIKTFQRNETLTLDEVLAKSGVKEIGTDSSDTYPSQSKVYGWVEDGNFYWWSEADLVYFHPKTRRAFNNYSNLTMVDLKGTSTSQVENFSHFFDTSRKLTAIKGSIDTSGLVLHYNTSYDYGNDGDENASGEEGVAYMFNDCNALTSVDISKIDTTNASDMKRMFAGCKALKEIDVSHFNTSNAVSMYWMFRNCLALTKLDLSNFDTHKVVNMSGMFLSSKALQEITFGNGFDTANVVDSSRMFNNMTGLQTIYASRDFVINPSLNSSDMFVSTTKLVGGRGTEYETAYTSSHKNGEYARISNEQQSGYFTYKQQLEMYTITYNYDGGTATNPSTYTKETDTFTLNNPEKEGYTFIGWTGSNGSTPNTNVSIEKGTVGNLVFNANYQQNQQEVTFFVAGPCRFGGSKETITGCSEYAGQRYVNTNISLYSAENYLRDYEISFTIDSCLVEEQDAGVTQFTLMNTKYESSANKYPGLVFRKDTSGAKYEITQTIEGKKVSQSVPIENPMSVKIVRRNSIIYYSINDGAEVLLQDMSNFTKFFDTPVTFGASLDAKGTPYRFTKATISNMKVVLK